MMGLILLPSKWKQEMLDEEKLKQSDKTLSTKKYQNSTNYSPIISREIRSLLETLVVDQASAYIESGSEIYYEFNETTVPEQAKSLFEKPNKLLKALRESDILIGIGCGKSEIEAAIIKECQSNIKEYIGIDFSSEMIEMTSSILSKYDIEKEFHVMDLFSISFQELLNTVYCKAKQPAFSMLGGLFGNIQPENLLKLIKLLIRDNGILIVDFNYLLKGNEYKFIDGMKKQANNDPLFFLGGLQRLGIDISDHIVETEFHCANFYTKCCFFTRSVLKHHQYGRLTADSVKIKLFEIYSYNINQLQDMLLNMGIGIMDMIDLHRSSRPQCICGLVNNE